MPTPQQIMAAVPYDQRTGGSPAGDAIRALVQQDAVQKRQGSLKFQDQVAQKNAAATQPFGDEQTPASLMQQVGQMQQPQQGAPMQQGQPGQPGLPPTQEAVLGQNAPPTPPPPGATNPGQGPTNPQKGPVPAPETDHDGGPKFQKGRRYV